MMYDALIVGGSFAGLSAAMQLARGRRQICVIDSGRPRNRFSPHSHGFFAQDGVAPAELIGAGRDKVAAYPNVDFRTGEAVAVAGQDGDFDLTLTSGEALRGRKLILAHGIRDHLPDLPGLRERWGVSVLHCPYCHGYEFGGKPLGVLHVAEMSAHQALLIPEWGPTTLFLNGGAMPVDDVLAQLDQRRVTIEPARIIAFEGDAPHLSAVVLADGRRLNLTALYLAPRTEMTSDLAHQLGCVVKDGVFGSVIEVDAFMATTVPGVLACGDITRSMHNATFASADGVMAGTMAHRSLIFPSVAA